MDFYVSANARLIAIIGDMAVLSGDAAVASQVIAYTILLKAKESAGIERAMVTAGFGASRFTPAVHRRFLRLVAQQTTLRAVFETHATDDQRAFLATIVSGAPVDEVERLREIAISSREKPLDRRRHGDPLVRGGDRQDRPSTVRRRSAGG